MRVTGLTAAPGANPLKSTTGAAAVDDGKTLLTTITGQVYMAANRPPALAAAVPGAPVTTTPAGPSVPVVPAKK
jgi:hypothetical protein